MISPPTSGPSAPHPSTNWPSSRSQQAGQYSPGITAAPESTHLRVARSRNRGLLPKVLKEFQRRADGVAC